MRASYRYTSVSLLVTLALSLFSLYASRPNQAAGAEDSLSAMHSHVLPSEITLEPLEAFSSSSPLIISSALATQADVNITLTSATSTLTRTTVQTAIEGQPSTIHRVEFFTSEKCTNGALVSGRSLGALQVTTNASGKSSFNALITPALTVGNFVAAQATNQVSRTSALSRCLVVTSGITTPTPTPTPTPRRAPRRPVSARRRTGAGRRSRRA